jgi:3-methyl-2-oxobutanoate hydroxymethyltransferase
MVVQGHQDTLSVSVDDMIYHGRCVSRGLQQAHLTVDMPFMSYQVSPAQALENAGRLVREGKAQSVKLEGGERSAAAIRMTVDAGIPVVGHVGLTPQSVNAFGGFRVQGRDQATADRIMQDALIVQDAGAFAVVLEMVPDDLAALITDALDVPTIGIGAGAGCDGQVLVCNDLLGMDTSFEPRFVRRYAQLETSIIDAIRGYADDVRSGSFPGPENCFRRKPPAKLRRVY